ncbi:MAG: alpha-galactosidase [Verrucomicrobia bacterium]|nr:alpha-galactosidase [Verrucomicrobiota bacterium]
MNRRTFLKSSAAIAGAACGAPLLADVERSAGGQVTLESAHLRLAYDLAGGRVSLFSAKDEPLLLSATAAVLLPRSAVLASDGNYSREARHAKSDGAGLEGGQLVVRCADATKTLELEHRVTLLADRPAAVFELVFTNVSGKDIVVRGAEPLRALLDERSGCWFGAGGVGSSVSRVLTNGFMCYDPGELADFNTAGGREVCSWWNAAFSIYGSRALVAGFLENRDAAGQVVARDDKTAQWRQASGAFDLTARAFYGRHFVVRPGQRVSSGRVLLQTAGNSFDGLESYAALCGQLHGVKLNPVVNGWCSWFYTRRMATEEEQLRNAEFVAKHLKPYGIEWVQVDAGWQRAFGDWQGNDLYPHGMKWLAQRIRALGLKPGIWIAPFEITAGTDVARQHPEWLVRDADGNIAGWRDQYAPWISSTSHALDVTHPGARKWLAELFKTITDDWGYNMVKIDRMEWTLLGAERYSDPAVSKAQAYRMGMETIRKAIGPGRHILDSGPMAMTVGLIDSARIEADVPPLNWNQYAKRRISVAPAAAHRYYFHGRTWLNDADHLGIAQMTLAQGRAAASIVALSGGTMILGDRLIQLDKERLEILKKVVPSFGEAARPLDLFEKAHPETFALRIKRDFESWWVVGCFNWNEEGGASRELSLARVGADPAKTCLVYDFWEQRLLAETRGKVQLQLEPSSVKLLGIRLQQTVPQLLGTDRHFTQGALELENVRWDAAALKLSGTAIGPVGESWTLAIHVPAGYIWEGKGGAFYQIRDSENILAVTQQTEPQIIRAQITFRDAPRVNWSFRFRRS